MARIRAIDGLVRQPVAGPWQLLMTPASACAGPGDLGLYADWLPARVPGTVAGALRDAGRWSETEPTPIHTHDVWYRAHLPGHGRERLHFEGLATFAEVWLDGVLALVTRSMFRAYAVDVELAPGSNLVICFRALAPKLAAPNRRGRWRPRLATPGSLRHVRTSLLGFMPGWCPSIDAVGPYRPITREPLVQSTLRVVAANLHATLDGTTGQLIASVQLDAAVSDLPSLHCSGREIRLREVAAGRFEGALGLPNVAPWWPHTHGEPRLHPVEALINGSHLDLGCVGFRSIALTRPFEEGLSLAINGVSIFCRGACWTPADLAGLSGEVETYRSLLILARESGMNMLRVPGIGLYETGVFHDLCDELGILVWQDLMLANFDYPHDDPAFHDDLALEIDGFLDRTQTSPSLCVLCGGSEVWQQAAMLGLPRTTWAGGFVAETLPRLVGNLRPDIVVVANSPSGGDLPFTASAGVTHYYGVGAYRRPLDDARRAEIGFASECLAFANVPEPVSLRGAGLFDPTSERWANAIPRDRGADWSFEDVRDHYLALLFGSDPVVLRRQDPERYLELGRATVAEVMEATFAEWRRPRSPTAGGLVWFLRDLAPGVGWGIIAAEGRPKSAWYALKRAFRPVQVTLSDEGLNGLHVHVCNETGRQIDGHLRLAFTNADGRTVAQAERTIQIEPREARTWSSAELFGHFFDATHAYCFGPAIHSLGHAILSDADGLAIAESFYFPHGRDPEPRAIGLRVKLVPTDGGWHLKISAERHALSVHVDTEDKRTPSDNWFHLAPMCERSLNLIGSYPPRGTVRALNGLEIIRFGQDDV